jgi:hypothetical protein
MARESGLWRIKIYVIISTYINFGKTSDIKWYHNFLYGLVFNNISMHPSIGAIWIS